MAITKVYAKIKDWLRYREAVRELSMRSDRELDDIGLLRADILDALKGSGRSSIA